MKIAFGNPPTGVTLPPSSYDWHAVKDPTPRFLKLSSFLLLIIVFSALSVMFGWGIRGDHIPLHSFLAVIVFSVAILPFHELAHALALPTWGPETSITFRWSFFAGLCRYTKELNKARYILFTLAPTFVLTILPLSYHFIVSPKSDLVAMLGVANALCSCGDYVLVGFVLARFPQGSVLLDGVGVTYWRRAT